MATSLANNLSEGIHKIKCKYKHNNKKCESCKIKYKYRDCYLEYTNLKDDLTEYKCLCCNKNNQHKLDEKLKKRSFNTSKVSNHDNNKFILLLRKCVYPYEDMDDWENFNKASLPEKEGFYSHLNMEDVTDADYVLAERVCKEFETKNFGKFHDIYVQINTFLLANAFENFRNM